MRAKLTSFLMILCLLMFFAAVAGAAPAGKVTNLEGRADLTAPGKPAKALFIGDAVNVGDILRTKSGSKLEVTWVDGSIARLSENSRLKVTEFSLGAQKRSTILSLFRGKVQNIVTGTTKLFGTKDGSKYEVHTPTSVCGVRGTIFFSYHENGVSGALFTEGQGFMYSKGQPGNVKPVAPGILMIVTSANKPPMAQPAKPGDANKLFNATNPSEKKKDDKKGEDKKEGGTGGGASGSGGGSAAAAGSTSGAGTDESSTGGTGTTGITDTTMLGGDPTATLGTAPPGTLASQIETGTTADTPGTSSPLTNPTQGPQVVVPVIEPTPPPTDTSTTFTQQVKSEGVLDGTLKGTISNTTNTGTISLTGTGPESIYVLPTTGTLSDGSTDNAYLAGIPGPWRGLFTGLYKKGSTIGILSSSDLNDAAYSGGALDAAGTVSRTEAGTTSDTATQLFPNLPLLVLQNFAIGQSFSDPVISGPYQESGITTEGIKGYNTSLGGILGIWGAKTLNGNYVNATGVASENVNLYHYSYSPNDPYATLIDHFAFGNVTATDDLSGHIKISGTDSLTYLDRQYLGKLSLDYRGVYYNGQLQEDQSYLYQYDSVGTGIYKLEPLSWSGDWGQNQGWWYYGPASLYQNTYYPEDGYSSMVFVAHDMGLVGGVVPFWTGTNRLTALGYLTDDSGTPISGETVAGPLLWNSGIGAQALTGTTLGEVFTPDAEFIGVTAGIWKDDLMNGSAYAIYKTAAGQAGWLIGAIGGTYDSDLGVWKAEGDLTPTQRIAQLPAGVTADDLEVFHDIGIGFLGGSFTGDQGIINNYQNIMQTTFYGKLISVYDEEYGEYVDKILPMRWGIYDLRMAYGNSFSGKPSGATSWTSKIGGYGPTQMQAPFFYLADISGNWLDNGTINGQLSGTYMTPLYLGVLSGPFYGLYTEEEISGSGGWIGQSIGTYSVTQKLAHSATWGENLYVWYSGEGGLFTDAGGWLDHTGYVMGLLGGTTAPWSGSSDFKAMGLFQLPVEFGLERGTYLWSGAIQGSVPREFTETASAGGIYTGYSSALWRTDSYTGSIRTMYLAPPDAVTGKSTVGFLAGDNIAGTIYNLVQDTQEYDGYVETYTVGVWEATGTNTLTASAPLVSGLDPEAVTLAGGYMNAKLSGTFGDAGALTNDTAWGDFTFFMNGATPLPFGVYDLKLGSGDPGGTFSGKPIGATSWDAKLGGGLNIGGGPALAVYGGYNYEYGYWLADVGGQWNAAGEITGNVTNGKYLTTTQIGTLSGPFYGLYTEGETTGAGTWVGQSIGNYEGQNLAFVSDLTPSLRYYNGSYWQTDSYSINGLLGSPDSLWSSTASTPALPTAMGMVSGTPAATGHIFNATTASHNYKDIEQVNTTYDGGAYYLFYGGSELSNHIAANLAGIYIYDGKAGLLQGGLNGNVYSDIGVWEASGSLYKEEKGSTTIAANELQNNLYGGSMTGIVSSEDRSLLGSTGYNYTQTLYDQNGGTNWIMNGGIWQADLAGSYSGNIPVPWTAKAGGTGGFGPYYHQTGATFIDDGGYWLADIYDGTASGNSLSAGISGWYLTKYTKGALAGNLIGTYGTSGNYWQAAAVGTFGDKQALAYSADAYGGWGSYNTTPGSEGLVPDGYGMSGTIGGVSSLFSGKADINGMGFYFRSEDSSLFTMVINNNYPWVGPETNPFHIYYGGSRVAASEYHPEWFEGKMTGFYGRNWDGTKYNEIGLITSGPLIVDGEDSGFSVWGDLYPNIENPLQNKMWAIPSDEDQGTLAYTAKPGTVSSFSIVESEWSPVAKVDGDLQGTMRMKSAHIDGIEDWGVWMSAMGGSYTDSIPAEWVSRTGWKETNLSGKTSYSIASVDGYSYDDGALWGGIIGRSLNPDNMGVFTGDMVGIASNGNWQAMGLGSFEAFPLAYNGAFVQDNGGFGYWDFANKKMVTEDSSNPPLPLAKIGGLIGGVGELFNGQGISGANLPVDLTGIGEYEAAKVGNYALFGTEIAGNNDVYATATNNYLLKFGGVRIAEGAGGALLGKGLGLYYRQTAADVYEVGLLSSSLIPARLYPAIGDPANPGMWEIVENLGSTLLASAKDTVQGSVPPVLNPVHDYLKRQGAIGTAAQKLGYISLDSTGYSGQNWGILYGSFGLDQGVLPVGSTALAGGTMLYQNGASPVTIGYWMGNISNIEALYDYTTGTYAGETIFYDSQNRVFQSGIVNTNPSALGANLVAVNDGSNQVGMTLADYMTTPMAFGSMINGSVQKIVNGTFYAREYERPYTDLQGYFRPLNYEYRYFPYPSATANATNGMAFERIEKQMGYHGTYNERYHYLYSGNYVGTTSINYINHLFQGGRTDGLSPVPNFTGASPDSPHFDRNLIVDGTTWFTADKYVKTLTSQWDNVNALVHDVPFQGILGGLPGENLWSATVSDPAQISLIGSVDTPAQYVTFSGNIAGTTDSTSEAPTNAYFASIGGILLGSAGGTTPLSGGVIGLYINQDNPSEPKAGILHGSFSGDAYAGIGMWDGTGSLWAIEHATDLGTTLPAASGLLTPGHPSLFTGVLGVDINDNLAGFFLDDQNASSGLIQSQIVTLGSTYNITGQTDWGIFTMTHAMNNTYSNPEGKTAWASAFAGAAEFGGYLSHNTYWTYRDAGFWKASITDGTWANGQIGGTVAGEFLTHKKYGTLTGKIQGVYTADAVGGTTGTWQDNIGGVWQKGIEEFTGDVYFSSAVYGRAYTLRHSQQGGAVYDKGSGINNYYSFYYEDDHAIWPDQYADATYTNNLDQRKTIYRFEMYGMPTSPVYRKNTWTQKLSDGTYTFDQEVYETRDEYLSAMAALENKPQEEGTGTVPHQGHYTLGDNSGFYGLMAGVGNLWDNLGSSNPTPLRFAGDINQFDTAERGFSLFAAQIVSFDPLATLDPFMNSRTPVWNGKSGAYLANMGGIADNQQNLTGSLQGLYLDDSGNVGIFYGNLTGRHDTALSMWGAEGSAYTYLMNTSSEITGLGLTPENFAGSLQPYIETNWNSISDPGLAGENVIGTDGSAIYLSAIQDTKIRLPSVYGGFDPNWRVDQALLGGTYVGTPSSWTWTFNSPNDTDWASVQITPSDTTNAFTGQMVGAKVNWAEGVTKVSGAEIKGLFDPNVSTWKAVAQGAAMETNTFLAKAAAMEQIVDPVERKAAQDAFMNATKIPAVLAGSTDLRGSGSVTGGSVNLGSASDAGKGILNAAFYAYSTGAKPQVWASSSVNGAYTGTPTAGTVNLSGYAPGTTGTTNGITANFNVQQFGATNWGATVTNGRAPANSLTAPQGGSATHAAITFQGGAAGPVNSTAGTFTGTAAGIAK